MVIDFNESENIQYSSNTVIMNIDLLLAVI